jgi:hypothetical protein
MVLPRCIAMGARMAATRTATAAVSQTRFAAPALSLRLQSRWMSTKYLESHEYCKIEGSTATVGITQFAAEALGDVVFVELPDVGDSFEKG